MKYDQYEGQDHIDQRYDNTGYDAKVRKLYKIMKKVTAEVSAKTKVRKSEKKKDGVLVYSDMEYYYEPNG